MSRRTAVCAVLAMFACVVLTGCMPKMTIEEMKAMMPERPAELDRLNMFVGKWQSEGQATMAMLDEPLETSGTSEAKWDDSRWFVVERGAFHMADFDEMTGLGAWTYDPKGKVYRSTWIDSMGTVGLGTAKYDEKSGVWKMKATSHGRLRVHSPPDMASRSTP